MLEVVLPFPPSELSPNSRLHWAKLAKYKKMYRQLCRYNTLDQVNAPRIPDGDLVLELFFVRPQRRSYDRDNLTARMKSGLDGVCDALKIDDKRFTTVIVKVDPEMVGGYVKVKISGEENGKKTL